MNIYMRIQDVKRGRAGDRGEGQGKKGAFIFHAGKDRYNKIVRGVV